MQEKKTKLQATAASRGLVRLDVVPSVYFGTYFREMLVRELTVSRKKDVTR